MTHLHKPVRTFLFVPGNKPTWIEKAAAAKADALILDLEDSVPPDHKAAAREIVTSRLAWLAEQRQRTWVRINRTPYLYDFDDILAVVGPHIEGVFISKPMGVEDVNLVSAMLSEAEHRRGMPVGSTRVIPIMETARAMQFAFELASHERVAALSGATARNGDVERALNTVWSVDGRESLYMKSRVVMAARAAGKLPIGGMWQQVHDLDGLRIACMRDRAIGMSGELVIHPSNVPIVNAVYSPSAEQLAYYRGMIAALDQAQAEGRASCLYDGEHIDIAHVRTAREIVAAAQERGGP
ncbi:HpcH/HpaI aldolase/citrate lyase family protein [Ramlibacter sp.]|uniref:HpcH/HpaI aldolase/citrate lyase family protein n=1 Tax=Ramlibacter sp. TaxID=1917967 RepID=UPI003D0B6D34